MKRRTLLKYGAALPLTIPFSGLSNFKNMISENDLLSANQPSKQIQDVTNWWVMAASRPFTTLEESRDFIEHWGDLTEEPGDVDYSEIEINGVKAMWIIPHKSDKKKVLLCIHGGGFVFGSIYTHRKLFAHLAKQIGCRALTVNYRLAPEHPHPAQVNDIITVYEWLLKQGIKPGHIALVGDSAGGGLSITTLLKARDKDLPMPASTVGISPWVDMELKGESMVTNSDRDVAFTKEKIHGLAMMFLGEKGNTKDPYANPLYADLKGLPPTYLHVGSEEVLLDDSKRLFELANKAGVDAKLDIYPNMQHTFQMAAGRAPESDESIARIAGWVKPSLGLK